MNNAENKVSIYVLAGVATSRDFMVDFMQELQRRYKEIGYEVFISMLFPYGDWNRSVIKQLREICGDLWPNLGLKRVYRRGQEVANTIISSYKGGKIVIIGHSSGGVVGVHAAHLLQDEKLPAAQVVQIGSPKYPIALKHRTSTLFIHSVNAKGRISDRISSIGTWGGWVKKGHFFRWNPEQSAPASIIGVPIIGGHADYFRNSLPFIDRNGSSNLEKTAAVIWEWLKS